MTKISRRTLAKLAVGGAAALSSADLITAALAAEKKIIFGVASKTVTPLLAPFVLPEYLGYFKQEGLTGEVAVLGSNAAASAAAEQGRIDTVVGVPTFHLQLLADKKPVNFINFFEYTYPFKWAVAVKPGSPIKKLSDMKGKIMGVHNMGTSEYQVGKILINLSGLDADKDVQWLAVGEAPGSAITKGDIDALIYFDTAFGTIEASGVKLDYLPLPDNVPHVGGLFIAATPKVFKERRQELIGYGRAVAKSMVFIEENPEAASYIFLQMHPEAGARNKTTEQKVADILVSLSKRMPLFKHYDKSITDFGYISPKETEEEVAFMGLQGKVPNFASLYTNELIKEINAFDREPIRQQAKAFKLPYKT